MDRPIGIAAGRDGLTSGERGEFTCLARVMGLFSAVGEIRIRSINAEAVGLAAGDEMRLICRDSIPIDRQAKLSSVLILSGF